jgi:hypothetical protein
MKKSQLIAWLKRDEPDLEATIIADIKAHLATVTSNCGRPYGYAVLPPDYCTAFDPTSLSVAFNHESNVADEHKSDTYRRYCVDEWKNFVHTEFDATNSEIKIALTNFRDSHTRAEGQFVTDEFERLYIDKIDRAVLNALHSLKRDGTFEKDAFLIIWYPGSDYEIMARSARELNGPELYELLASTLF